MVLDITCPQAAHASNCILKWRPWYMGSLVIQASTTVQTSCKYSMNDYFPRLAQPSFYC